MREEPVTGSRPARKARAVGINHVALDVGDVDEALALYGGFLEFEIARRSESAAFIYFGDQFIDFSRGRRQAPDDDRHFGGPGAVRAPVGGSRTARGYDTAHMHR